MSNNFISALEEQFNKECIIIDLSEEYPDMVGEEKYAIVTDIPSEEFVNEFYELLEKYTPYLIVGTYFLEVVSEYNAIEYKYEKRQKRKGMLFPIDEIATLKYPELRVSDCADEFLINERNKNLNEAISALTTIQKERIYQRYWEQKSVRGIAKDEGKDYKTIAESLHSAEKKLKNFLETLPQKAPFCPYK